MNLYQIRYFLAIVDAGNFSRAAQRTHVAQSTLSTGIHKLEEELGQRLFERNNRAVCMTPHGQQFLGHAKTIYQEMEKARQALKPQEKVPLLRIGVLKTVPMNILAKIIHDFHQIHPGVNFELTDDSDEVIRGQLGQGKLDIGFTSLVTNESRQKSLLLYQEIPNIAVGQSHPVARLKKATFEVLHGQPFIQRLNCSVWDGIKRELARRGVQPRTIYRAESDQTVLSLISAGVGLSIMSPRPNRDGVKFIPIQGMPVWHRIGIIWMAKERVYPITEFCTFAQSANWTQ